MRMPGEGWWPNDLKELVVIVKASSGGWPWAFGQGEVSPLCGHYPVAVNFAQNCRRHRHWPTVTYEAVFLAIG